MPVEVSGEGLSKGRNELCGIRDQRGGKGSQPWDQGSQTMELGSAVFFRDQGSGCTIFVGSGTKIGHAFGTNGVSFDEAQGNTNEMIS